MDSQKGGKLHKLRVILISYTEVVAIVGGNCSQKYAKYLSKYLP